MTKQEIRMSSASSVLPSDLVSVEVAAQQVGAHPQTSLTKCTFPVLYPVPAPERGPRWQTHAQRRNLVSFTGRMGTTLGDQWVPPERLRRGLFDHSRDQDSSPAGLATTS